MSRAIVKGGAVSEETKQAIRERYEVESNKTKIAREFNVSLSTVHRALGKIDPEEARERRREGMSRVADEAIDQVEFLLKSTKKVPAATSYMQRMTAVGILVDKVEKLDRRMEESKRADEVDANPIPHTIEALWAAIRIDLRGMSQFVDLLPAQAEAVRQLEAEVPANVVEAEVIGSIDALDGGA